MGRGAERVKRCTHHCLLSFIFAELGAARSRIRLIRRSNRGARWNYSIRHWNVPRCVHAVRCARVYSPAVRAYRSCGNSVVSLIPKVPPFVSSRTRSPPASVRSGQISIRRSILGVNRDLVLYGARRSVRGRCPEVWSKKNWRRRRQYRPII